MNLKFEEICGDLLNILKSSESVCQILSYFNEEWSLNIKTNLEEISRDVFNKIDNGTIKLLEKSKKCIIFGETSAGKSFLLNAILGTTILHSGNGITTTGYVTIKKSSNEESYVIIGNEKRGVDVLKGLNESEQMAIYHADLYYNESKWPFMSKYIEIIDTPGVDEDDITDDNVNKYCDDAHFVILVVDGTQNLNKTLKSFVSKIKSVLLKLHIFIVFNKWDKIKDQELEKVRTQHFTFAKEMLCKTLNYSEEEAVKRIFFLSSKRQLKDSSLCDHKPNQYQEAFKLFLRELEKEMEDTQEKIDFLRNAYTLVSNEVQSLKDLMNVMKNQMKNIIKSFEDKNKKIKIVKTKILNKISEICDQSYGKFNEELLKEIEMTVKNIKLTTEESKKIAEEHEKKNDKQNIGETPANSLEFLLPFVDSKVYGSNSGLIQSDKSENEQMSTEDKKELLLLLVQKSLTKTVFEITEKLNAQFQELVNDQKDRHMIDRLGLVKVEYNPQENEENIFSFTSVFLENILNIAAQKLTKLMKIIIGAVSAAALALLIGTGGVAGAIIAPIEFALAAYIGIGVGGVVGGGALGAGVAVAIVHLTRIDWKERKAKSEQKVADKWKKFKSSLYEQYEKHLDDFIRDLKKSFEDVLEKINKIEINLAEVNNRINGIDKSVSRRLF